MKLDLDAIEARANAAIKKYALNPTYEILDTDVPALVARVRELEDALRPFANWGYGHKDGCMCIDCRARAVLGEP